MVGFGGQTGGLREDYWECRERMKGYLVKCGFYKDSNCNKESFGSFLNSTKNIVVVCVSVGVCACACE